jgi:hypothetical protein
MTSPRIDWTPATERTANPNVQWALYPDGKYYAVPTGTTPPMAPVQPVSPQGYGYNYQVRRQSVKVHALLALTTGGIGNILYAMWAKSRVAARWKW